MRPGKNRRKSRRGIRPTQKLIEGLNAEGYASVAGIDEVGRGSLAGPVVAAAVLLPAGVRIAGVRDSKLITEKQRRSLAERIKATAAAVGIGWVHHEEINQHGLTWAVCQSGQRALQDMSAAYDAVLLDGSHNYLKGFCFSRAVVRADQHCLSVASASIVAKVARDDYMQLQHHQYPDYDFHTNKGYATPGHLRRLEALSPIHRVNYAPVRAALRGVD